MFPYNPSKALAVAAAKLLEDMVESEGITDRASRVARRVCTDAQILNLLRASGGENAKGLQVDGMLTDEEGRVAWFDNTGVHATCPAYLLAEAAFFERELAAEQGVRGSRLVRNAMYGVASPAVANREAGKLRKYSPLLVLGILTNEKLRKPAVAKPVFFPAVVEDGGQFGDGLFKLIVMSGWPRR